MVNTVKVTGYAYHQNGEPAANAKGVAILSQYEIDDGVVVPHQVVFRLDDSGYFEIDLWPNERGTGSSSYEVIIYLKSPEPFEAIIYVPEVDHEVRFKDILVQLPPPPISDAERILQEVLSSTAESKVAATASKTSATESANSAEASKAFMEASQASATDSLNSANASATSASEASSSASAAKASEDSASASEQVAITKASEASQSATDSATSAQESKLSAESSEVSNQSAIAHAINAVEAKDEVIGMRDEVLSLEQSSEDSAELSKNWAINMTGLVDGEDYSSKYYANESKDFSEASETSSINSEASAVRSKASEDNSLASEQAAKSSETIAKNSATASSNSASASAASASAASDSETNAAASESVASTKADEASASASSAADSATIATNKAGEASSSAAAAATSESDAASSATAAANSASQAANTLSDIDTLLDTKADKSISITGEGALVGGGTLEGSITIDASPATKASLLKADNSVQTDQIVHTAGSSMTHVMSQNSFTEAITAIVSDLNKKANKTIATRSSDGLLSKEDKAKLDSLEIYPTTDLERLKTALYVEYTEPITDVPYTWEVSENGLVWGDSSILTGETNKIFVRNKITATRVANIPNRHGVVRILYWGNDIEQLSMIGGENLVQVPTTLPNSLTNARTMFIQASIFNQDISSWDVRKVQDMSQMFYLASSFTQDLSSWDGANAVYDYFATGSGIANSPEKHPMWEAPIEYIYNDLGEIVTYVALPRALPDTFYQKDGLWFYVAPEGELFISQWRSAGSEFGTDMYEPFRTSSEEGVLANITDSLGRSHEIPLNQVVTSKVTSLRSFAHNLDNFNQDVSKWDVSDVVDMGSTFSHAINFNQDLSNWDVSNVKDMSFMFSYAHSFAGILSAWDTGNVIDMTAMFQTASSFFSDISSWDTSSVTRMQNMFYSASAFNHNINQWDVSKVTDMRSMFRLNEGFNQPLDNWDVSSVTRMDRMFGDASTFNQDLSQWCVTNISNKPDRFDENTPNWDKTNRLPVWGTCPERGDQ